MTAWLAQIKFGLALILVLLAYATGALSQNTVESLVQPDVLSEPHKKLEADCSNCHKAFKKAAQSSLCADCHKPIKQDISKGQGYHGRSDLVRKSECFNCHAEHKGRDFKQARFTFISFDHNKTDYPLDGKHLWVDCSGCHKAGKKFAEAAHACFDCHKNDQPHLGNLGTKCKTCHSTADWKKIAPFDHDKTKFALKGAHAKATCFGCHVGEIYKGLSTGCFDCHAMQDVHETRFGKGCENCHSVEDWKHTRFDHGKFTKFALTGAHAAAACKDCHGEKLTSRLPVACFECHKEQDLHLGQLGKDCAACHATTAWRQDVVFDHALTKFPLLGQHAAVACESCHASAAFQDAKTDCYSCHKADDIHAGRFTAKCESCHTASGWNSATFNHDRDTKFKLTGKHVKVGCNGCHVEKNAQSAKVPAACYSCHKQQDIHRGAFGQNCGACHTTQSFKGAVIRK
jgi:Zn finger protein HypA/HybF involved in hydrogenase expression